MELFKSLESKIKLFRNPFKHFEINEPLTQNAIDEICNAQIGSSDRPREDIKIISVQLIDK